MIEPTFLIKHHYRRVFRLLVSADRSSRSSSLEPTVDSTALNPTLRKACLCVLNKHFNFENNFVGRHLI